MLLNRERALGTMDKYGLSALIATSPDNVTYLSDFSCQNARLYRHVNVFAILPRRDDISPTLIVIMMDVANIADGASWMEEVRTYGRSFIRLPEGLIPEGSEVRLMKILKASELSSPNSAEALCKAIEDKGLAKERVGLDEVGIGHRLWGLLQERFPEAEFVEASEIFREIQVIKTEEELARLREATEINEAAVEEVAGRIAVGVSEAELAQLYREALARRGADLDFWNTGGGRRSGGFFPSGDYALKPGDLYRFDAGSCFRRYHADAGGVAVLGEPTARQRELYDAISAGMEAALEKARPGATYADLFNAAVGAVEAKGIKNYDKLRSDCGHGIGIEARHPNVSRDNTVPLEENMVVNVEVPYYEVGYGGVQKEYSLLITRNGFELLVPLERKMIVV